MSNLYFSNITGILDVDTIVNALLQAKKNSVEKLVQKKAIYQANVSSLNNLLGALKEVKNSFNSLTFKNLSLSKKVEVSDSSVLSGSASEKTPEVSLKVKVIQLSQGEIRISNSGVSNLNEFLSAGTFTLKYWTSDNNYILYEVNFPGGTLEDLVNTINKIQDKVLASTFFDGTFYKLMLTEKDLKASTKETSEDSAVIEIEGNFPLDNLQTFQNAQNSKIQLGSNSYYIISSNNIFEDVISGLNLTVYKIGEASVSVKKDSSSLNSILNEFLSKINGVIDLVNSLLEKGGSFQGNSTITQIKVQFFNLLQPLIKLGILDISEKGKYFLNTENLNLLLKSNLANFQNTVLKVRDNFSKTLDGLIKTLEVYKNTQDSRVKFINEKIDALGESLIKEEKKLRLKFSQIEALMYENEQLRTKLESFVVSFSESSKKWALKEEGECISLQKVTFKLK